MLQKGLSALSAEDTCPHAWELSWLSLPEVEKALHVTVLAAQARTLAFPERALSHPHTTKQRPE